MDNLVVINKEELKEKIVFILEEYFNSVIKTRLKPKIYYSYLIGILDMAETINFNFDLGLNFDIFYNQLDLFSKLD